MTEDDLREILARGDRRNERMYNWLRNLLLLAGGALTVLVALRPDPATNTAARWFWRVALSGLGGGILLGSIALYGEVWFEREMVNRLVEYRRQRPSCTDATPSPIVVKQPKYFRWAELACYLALTAAVCALMAFGMLAS